MDQEHDQQAPPASDHPFLTFFYQRYRPVSTFKDATEYLTTEQIVEEISKHAGDFISIPELHDWLAQSGYKCESMGGLKMVWLLKEEQ